MVLGFPKKGPGAVGCYGKLPRYGDYVSIQSDGAEARELTAWLDAGYRLTGGRDDPEAAEIRFVLPGRKAMLGAFWPSVDLSGTRRFPFALFTTTSGRTLAGFSARIPLAADGAWEVMHSALPDIRQAERADGIAEILSAIDVPETEEEAPLDAVFADESGREADLGDAPPLAVDLIRLADAVDAERHGDRLPGFAFTLPLTTGYPSSVEASAWLEILTRRLSVAALPGACRLFLRPSRDGRPGDLTVVHRELRPDDLGFLLKPTPDYSYANVLGADPDGDAAAGLMEKVDSAPGALPTLKDLVAAAARPDALHFA